MVYFPARKTRWKYIVIMSSEKLSGFWSDESVLDETGKVDATKLNAFVFDQFRNGYYAIGEKVGQAWHTGTPLMKE